MTKYVKKRIPVEAVEFNPARDGLDEAIRKVEEFTTIRFLDIVNPEDWETSGVRELAVFDTIHNTWVTFYEGDWIIKGIEGEFYPHNGELFPKVYEEYNDD